MLKKAILLGAIVVLLSPMAMAQQGPYTLSIGSGDGSVSYDVYSWGNMRDTCTYDPTDAASASGLIWNLCWFVYDETNDVYYFMDGGFTATTHTDNRITDGTVANTSTQVTNTGISFPNSTGLSADMTLDLTQTGTTPKLTYEWAFSNSGSVAMPIRLLWFVDVDNYLNGTAYDANYIGMTESANNDGLAIVIGTDSGLNMNQTALIDTTTAPDRWLAVSYDSGSSYYWSSSLAYAGIAPEDVKQIDDSLNMVLENDADNNLLSDAGSDCAGVMQWNVSVPTSGSVSVTTMLSWGPGGTYLEVEKWNKY